MMPTVLFSLNTISFQKSKAVVSTRTFTFKVLLQNRIFLNNFQGNGFNFFCEKKTNFFNKKPLKLKIWVLNKNKICNK